MKKLEIVKMTWTCYIPAALAATSTIGFIIMGRVVDARRSAALTAACAATTKIIEGYQDAIVESQGEKGADRIRAKKAEDYIRENPPTKENIIATGHGQNLFLDPLSGRYFWSTHNEIDKARNEFNDALIHNDSLSLNDWYDMLGMPHIKLGEEVGWTSDRQLKYYWSYTGASDGTPCGVIDYEHMPTPRYRNVYL